METLLAGHPDHIGAREALVAALADAGEPDRGRALLDDWPERARDARYWRLRGRWELEYDHRPDRAAAAFQTAVAELPQDWRSWYRLARALRILGRDREGRQAAETVSRIREVLDPLTLGPQLDAAFDHLDDPAALRNLAALCDRAGLTRLADAWRTEAQVVTPNPRISRPDLIDRQPTPIGWSIPSRPTRPLPLSSLRALGETRGAGKKHRKRIPEQGRCYLGVAPW